MFFQPTSIRDALARKAELRESAQFVAGGTDLVVLMNHGKAAPKNLIDLTHCRALYRLRRVNGRFELGGNVTFAACAELTIGALAAASLGVGGPGIRELGTLAGNLATASPAGDGSTALLALDADVELASTRGSRRLPLSDFFLGYRKTALAPDEIIRAISIPSTYRSAWAKVGKRGAVNISIVAAAVARTPDDKIRIALASVAPTPIRCRRAEKLLAEEGLGRDAIRRASDLVRDEITPIDDHRAGADYKRHLSGVLVRRLLERLSS